MSNMGKIFVIFHANQFLLYLCFRYHYPAAALAVRVLAVRGSVRTYARVYVTTLQSCGGIRTVQALLLF